MTLAEYKETVEDGINDWFEAEIKTAPTAESRLLLNRVQLLVKRGGKRARPELLYITYVAYGGENPAILIDLGLALELHHQFLLAHDDIIDNDTIRYNGPNVVGYYKQEKHNIPQTMGLLAGDILYSFACQLIVRSVKLTSDLKLQILNELNEANTKVQYGQQLDAINFMLPLSSFTEDFLILTHTLKSASYSAQLPMKCAALLLKLDSKEQIKIDNFARQFGILFQLLDDYSDYFINHSVFNNRPKYRDYRQGKTTHPLYCALKSANQSEITFLRKNFGRKNLSDRMMQKVIAILERSGAQESSRKYIENYFLQTRDLLSKLSIDSKAKQQFTNMLSKYEV